MTKATRERISKSLKRYHRAVREIRKITKSDYQSARRIWKTLSTKQQKPVTANWVKQHKAKVKKTKVALPKPPKPLVTQPSIDSIEQWMELYEPSWEYESPTVFEGTAEYE